MTQSISGEWSLSASADLEAETLEQALHCARQTPSFLIPGDPDEIESAVVRLKAATMRPMWMDGEDAVAYEEALLAACADYPLDVVQSACAEWRKVPDHGKWWPTEQDIRALCEKLFQPRRTLFNKARVLLQDLRAREDDARRNKTSAFAGRQQEQFRDEMRRRLSPARFEAYFHPAYVLFHAADAIIVSNMTAERVLNEEGGDVLKRLGLRVIYDPKPFVKVRRPSHEDDTPEERAEVTRKLNRLKLAMAKGENLKRLREEGAI